MLTTTTFKGIVRVNKEIVTPEIMSFTVVCKVISTFH